MIRLSSIVKAFGASFIAQYRDKLLPSHRKALSAMENCRTAQSPKMLVGCTQCDQHIYVPHSCGHRSCPHCQNHQSQQWTPVPFFVLKAEVRARRFLPRRAAARIRRR